MDPVVGNWGTTAVKGTPVGTPAPNRPFAVCQEDFHSNSLLSDMILCNHTVIPTLVIVHVKHLIVLEIYTCTECLKAFAIVQYPFLLPLQLLTIVVHGLRSYYHSSFRQFQSQILGQL
jgi:hypothetical protein